MCCVRKGVGVKANRVRRNNSNIQWMELCVCVCMLVVCSVMVCEKKSAISNANQFTRCPMSRKTVQHYYLKNIKKELRILYLYIVAIEMLIMLCNYQVEFFSCNFATRWKGRRVSIHQTQTHTHTLAASPYTLYFVHHRPFLPSLSIAIL